MNQLFFLVLIILLNTFSSFAQSQGAQVFQKVSPSIVVVTSGDNIGSGVLISSKGLVITNYHVVASPLPISIKMTINGHQGFQEQSFSKVRIKQIHPRYDLAILEIEGFNSKVQSLKFKPINIKTGEQVYAIGNPQGLEKSITPGIISSKVRKIEGLEYIQTSASINPGNSGGALVNSKGDLIGIVTFKMMNGESLGFAIPISKIKSKDFIPLEKKSINKQKANKLLAHGNKYFKESKSDPYNRQFYINIAAYFYYLALTEDNTNPDIYFNLGTTQIHLKKFNYAEAFLKKAYSLNPKNSGYIHNYAIAVENLGQTKKALSLYLKGAYLKGYASHSCARDASNLLTKEHKYLQASYLLQFAIVLLSEQDESTEKTQKKKSYLASFQEVASYLKPGTKEFLQYFNKLEMFKPNGWQNIINETTNVITKLQEKQKLHYKKFLISKNTINVQILEELQKLPELPNRGKIININENLGDIIPLQNGAYIAFLYPKSKKVKILSTLNGKWLQEIPLIDENSICASGGNKFIIYSPAKSLLMLYDTNSLKRNSVKKIDQKYKIEKILMGTYNGDYALISYFTKKNDQRRKLGLLTIKNLKIHPIDPQSKFRYHYKENKIHWVSNSLLTKVGIWMQDIKNTSWQELNLDLVIKNSDFKNHYVKTFSGLSLSADGNHFTYTKSKTEKTNNVDFSHSFLFTLIDENYYLEFDSNNQSNLRDLEASNKISSSIVPLTISNISTEEYLHLPSNKLVNANLLFNRLTIIDPVNNYTYIKQLVSEKTYNELLTIQNNDNNHQSTVFAKISTHFKMNLNFPNSRSIKLEDAPVGMTIKNNTIQWNVPSTEKPRRIDILFSVINDKGEESFPSIIIKVVK